MTFTHGTIVKAISRLMTAVYLLPIKAGCARRIIWAALFICQMAVATAAQSDDRVQCSDQLKNSQGFCREAYDLLLSGDSGQSDLIIFAIGLQNAWRYEYQLPTASGEAGSGRVCTVSGALILPEGRHVQLRVTSEDLIYEWTIPSLGIAADAIPGRLETVNFETSSLGETVESSVQPPYTAYEGGIGVHILEQSNYAKWERDHLRANCQPSP